MTHPALNSSSSLTWIQAMLAPQQSYQRYESHQSSSIIPLVPLDNNSELPSTCDNLSELLWLLHNESSEDKKELIVQRELPGRYQFPCAGAVAILSHFSRVCTRAAVAVLVHECVSDHQWFDRVVITQFSNQFIREYLRQLLLDQDDIRHHPPHFVDLKVLLALRAANHPSGLPELCELCQIEIIRDLIVSNGGVMLLIRLLRQTSQSDDEQRNLVVKCLQLIGCASISHTNTIHRANAVRVIVTASRSVTSPNVLITFISTLKSLIVTDSHRSDFCNLNAIVQLHIWCHHAEPSVRHAAFELLNHVILADAASNHLTICSRICSFMNFSFDAISNTNPVITAENIYKQFCSIPITTPPNPPEARASVDESSVPPHVPISPTWDLEQRIRKFQQELANQYPESREIFSGRYVRHIFDACSLVHRDQGEALAMAGRLLSRSVRWRRAVFALLTEETEHEERQDVRETPSIELTQSSAEGSKSPPNPMSPSNSTLSLATLGSMPRSESDRTFIDHGSVAVQYPYALWDVEGARRPVLHLRVHDTPFASATVPGTLSSVISMMDQGVEFATKRGGATVIIVVNTTDLQLSQVNIGLIRRVLTALDVGYPHRVSAVYLGPVTFLVRMIWLSLLPTMPASLRNRTILMSNPTAVLSQVFPNGSAYRWW